MALEQFNIRLDTETRKLIERLAKETGLSLTDIVRLAVRDYAKRHSPEPKKS